MKNRAVIFFLLIRITLVAQDSKWSEIEGTIMDNENFSEVPYANIFNYTTKSSTKANEKGEFRITISGNGDSLVVSSIGFEKSKLDIIKDKKQYMVYLDPKSKILGRVNIKPSDNSELYFLIHKCKFYASQMFREAKSFYELKTYINSKQVELIESYYNSQIQGYSLKGTDLKVGRFALQKDSRNNQYFTSQEGSKAILLFNMMSEDKKFPIGPLSLDRFRLKKKFQLLVENSYLNVDLDSIIVLRYYPYDTSGLYFNGSIWINKSKNEFEKITFNCMHCQRSPFEGINAKDELKNIDFNITQEFNDINNVKFFSQINFNYKLSYLSNLGRRCKNEYIVETNAILYAYDFNQIFDLPRFQFNNLFYPVDYSKINAFPYNDFFWKYNDELKMNANLIANETFFSDTNSITNRDFFQHSRVKKVPKIHDRPFVHWSEKRIRFAENIVKENMISEEDYKIFSTYYDNLDDYNFYPRGMGGKKGYITKTAAYMPIWGTRRKPYDFSVKIFMDVNTYKDSTNVLTSTVIDPNESYYFMRINNRTSCFMNMYFDLCEMTRRDLLKEIEVQNPTISEMNEIYKNQMKSMEGKCKTFLESVYLGEKEHEMRKWNQTIKEKIGIDNLELFNPKFVMK